MTFRMTCKTVLMIVGPPEAPAVSTGRPRCITIIGDILESGRLPGAISLATAPSSLKTLGTPGPAAKSTLGIDAPQLERLALPREFRPEPGNALPGADLLRLGLLKKKQ